MSTNNTQSTNESVQKEIDELEALEKELEQLVQDSEQLDQDLDAHIASSQS